MQAKVVVVRHKTLPGKRDVVRALWEQHMIPALSAHPGHLAYFYCLDEVDPDALLAFQVYASPEAARDFLTLPAYLAYQEAVEPWLASPPEVNTSLALAWAKYLK